MFSILKRIVRKPNPAAWMVRRDGRLSALRARPLVQKDITPLGESATVHLVSPAGAYSTQTIKDALPAQGGEFFRGTVGDKDLAWQFETADEIRRRCVPWAGLAIGPYLEIRTRHFDGKQVYACGLATHDDQGHHWILLGAQGYRARLVSTMHHECWHVAECALEGSVLNAIDAELSRQHQTYGGDYYMCDRLERRARAYEHFASLADEGLPVLVDPNRKDTLGVMSAVYTGHLAQALAANGMI